MIEMTDADKAIFDEQVNVLVHAAMLSADSRPADAKQIAYAMLLLLGATVKLALCGGYRGGPADLSQTLTRMWDATRYVGKDVNTAGGDA